HACDRLRESTGEEVDPVLDLDDVLVNDPLFALVLANLGLETLDSQVGAAGKFLRELGESQALLLKRDDVIQILEPFVEPHKEVIIVGNLCDHTGHDVLPPLTGGEEAHRCRVLGIMQLPIDVRRPGEEEAKHEIWHRIRKKLPGAKLVGAYAGSR